MNRLSYVFLLALSATAFAQDQLPEVKSLLPSPDYTQYQSHQGFDDGDSHANPQEQAGTDSQEQLLINALKRINALQEQVQELNGKVEEQEFKLSQLQAMYSRELDELKKVLAKIDEVSTPSTTAVQVKPKAEPMNSFSFSEPTAASVRLEGEVYQSAYQHLQAKRYIQAKSDFQEVIKNYPNGQFAPNSYYWLGEIYLLQDSYDKANESFKAVTDKFATHPKSADALLKLGFVAIHQKNYAQAKSYFIEVKEKFPNTVAARLAENRLGKLDNS